MSEPAPGGKAVHRRRLRVSYIGLDAPVPARGGYSVRTQTVMEALHRVADARLIALLNAPDAAGVAATRARFATDAIEAPRPSLPGRALIHAGAALANRNRWVEKYRRGAVRERILAAIAAHDPDYVIFSHTAVAALRDALELPPARTIIDHHNVESLNYARMVRQRRGLGKLVAAVDLAALRRLERRVADAADHWAVSEVDAAVLRRILARDVAVVPNVAPDEAFAIRPRGTQDDAPAALGFMATYGYFPNVEAALEFCAVVTRLRGEGVAVSATALGANAPPHLVRACAEAGVALPGFVPDARPILEALTLLVAPIRSGSGTKLKIIEALAMGLPVVTTPIGAEGIPIEAERIGVVAEDTAAIVAAARRLVENRDEARRLGERARRWAEANASLAALTSIVGHRLATLPPTRP